MKLCSEVIPKQKLCSGSVFSESRVTCAQSICLDGCYIYGVLHLESDNLHEDVRQGRIPDERKEIDRDEKNPPSNGEAACGSYTLFIAMLLSRNQKSRGL